MVSALPCIIACGVHLQAISQAAGRSPEFDQGRNGHHASLFNLPGRTRADFIARSAEAGIQD